MHQPSGGMGGTASDIRVQAELILSMKKRLAELTAEQTRSGSRDHPFATMTVTTGSTPSVPWNTGSSTTSAQSAGNVTGGGGTYAGLK